MKGYLSFVLVFVSVLVLLYLLEAQFSSRNFELSKAITVQRAYALQMNVKENLLEIAKQGAREGFDLYNSTHNLSSCMHCPDHFCTPGPSPNNCDLVKCSACFRENEARQAAVNKAVEKLMLLRTHHFDHDFDVSIGITALSAHLKPNLLSPNGFALSHIQFQYDTPITLVSKKFEVSAKAKIPRGCVIYDEGPSYC